MQVFKRLLSTLGLIGLLSPSPALGAPVSATEARPAPPRMSGPEDKPVPGDSRFPGEQPRPTGALLGPLPIPSLSIQSESIALRCRFGGGGCSIRQEFVIQNTGDATEVTLSYVTPVMGSSAEVDGRPAQIIAPTQPSPTRRWASSGYGVDPGSGARYALPGPKRHRTLLHRRFRARLRARSLTTVALITNSVAGYDRFRRGRTQPEVSFALTRRNDNFVHHHELQLRDPAARSTPGGRARAVRVSVILPRGLTLGSTVALRCKTTTRERRCEGRLGPDTGRWRWSLAQSYKRPVGFFLGAGVAFTTRGAEPLLRGGMSLMVRSRKDLVTLSAETDAKERIALALVYQLFLPYAPHSMQMGGHFELGMVLDVHPAARPAIRAGAAFHFALVRINLLFDLYPGETKTGGAPAWRGIVAAGLGF
ncbi:MAG: hypothetical protein ABI333_01440 [bacterium]